MNKETLKKVLDGNKIQDSANCEKLTTILKDLGFKVGNKSASFYLIDGNTAVPVSAVVFKNLVNYEVSSEDLYSNFEESKTQYEEGEILTAVRGEEHYTFIYLKEHTDGTLLGLGMCAEGLGRGIMRYTKKRCRHATEEEKKSFVELCKFHGVNTQILDGNIDVFKLRCYGQKYYSAFINFASNEIDVEEYEEMHDSADDLNFKVGNYFRSEEAARKAFTTFVNGL